jgi:hypothetical protein
LFRGEVLDLTKASLLKHLYHLVGGKERGEIDIQQGGEKRPFPFGLRSGHDEGEDDFRPWNAASGPAKGVADRGRRQILRDAEPGDERRRFWQKPRSCQRVGDRTAFEVTRREPTSQS